MEAHCPIRRQPRQTAAERRSSFAYYRSDAVYTSVILRPDVVLERRAPRRLDLSIVPLLHSVEECVLNHRAHWYLNIVVSLTHTFWVR